MIRKNKFNTKNTIDDKLIFLIVSPFLIFYFFLSELLPRMNFTLLPDRYWFMFDIALLILLVEIFKIIEKTSKVNYNKYLILFVFMIAISMGGSFYVAKEKKSLTTKSDFVASQWILNNTPKDAVFITQASNTPMIYYFARRKSLDVEINFFMEVELKINYLEKIINNDETQINSENTRIREAVDSINSKNENYNNSILIIEEAVKNKDLLANKLQHLHDYNNAPLYILYSDNKFSNIYDQRIWWKNVNYYGAKLEKFNYYPLVYSSDGVYIWKIK